MKKGLICLLALIVLFWGCSKKNSETAGPVGNPQDYLSTETGKVLRYKITLGEIEPLQYKEIYWRLGDKDLLVSTKGRFLTVMQNPEKKNFILELVVKGPAANQGELQYPIGVEYEIKTDEMGIFENAERVFLAATRSGRFMAHVVVTYPPDAPGAPSGPWGTWGAENGYSMQLIFFGAEPGTQIGMGEEPKDKLSFVGLRKVPGGKTPSSLYFVRTVESSFKENPKDANSEDITGDSIISKGFSEEMWFVRGKGLVRLEQKIEGRTSMIWQLE